MKAGLSSAKGKSSGVLSTDEKTTTVQFRG